MAGEFLSSKIVVQEEEPRIPALPVIPTAVLGAVGKTVRGPLNSAVLCTSFEEFVRSFGEYRVGYELPLAIRAFFMQGGRTAYVVRAGTGGTAGTRAMVAGNDAQGTVKGSIAGPYALANGDTIIVSVDGGGNQTATVTAAVASVSSGNTAPFALANSDTLTVKINGGSTQTITFTTGQFSSIGAATAAEVCAVINASLVGGSATPSGSNVVIRSDRKGTGASVQVTGGTANAGGKLNFSTSVVAGTGNVSNVDAVTATELASIINGAVSGQTTTVDTGAVRLTSNTTGSSSSIQVISTSTADDELGLDNAAHTGSTGGTSNAYTSTASSVGTWSSGLRQYVRAATSGVANDFNLEVELDGFIVERFPNVNTTDSTSDRYIEKIVNDPKTGSLYMTVAVNNAVRPNNNTTGLYMTGGADPTVTDTELVGDTSPSLTGIRALDTVEDITMLIVPDGPTLTVANAMVTYAEITRNRAVFAILDPPAGASASGMVTHVTQTGFTASENAAIYWPRVRIPNPSARIYGVGVDKTVMTISGHVAGLIARNDASKAIGPFSNPAGVEDGILFGVVDLETDNHEVLREEKRDLVFPKRINPIVATKGIGIYPDGARTLLGTSNFPSVGERRGVSAIESQAKAALLFAKNKPNTEDLRDRVELVLTSIVLPYIKAGALASKDPSKAFFLDVSEQLNNAQVRAEGKLKARLGLATAKPAEFIMLLVTQDVRALQEELLGQ